MKILLIMPHPNPKPKRSVFTKIQYPSLTLQQIAGITPREHEVQITDERFEKINFDVHYDLVGISCLTYNSLRGYQISKIFRDKKIPVVFGGYHASLLPDEVKQHADAIVIGEAEYTWPKVIEDVKKGTLKPIYKSDKFVDPVDIPPARHDIGKYTFMDTIQAGRGCPTGCEFCSMQKIEGKRFRGRPVESIVAELETIKAKTIFFADSSLTVSPPYSKKLFKELIPLNKKFHCYSNINVLAKDDEFLKLSQEAGFKRWCLGIESISQENINQAGKSTNTVEEYGDAIKKIKDYGMEVTGFFIFGLDHDTKETFQQTLDTIYTWNLDQVAFSVMTPYPGTRLFDRMEQEGRITRYDWSRYEEGKVNFTPKNMTPEELIEGIRQIAMDFYSVKNCVKRSFKSRPKTPSMILSTLVINLGIRSFYKREKYNIDE